MVFIGKKVTEEMECEPARFFIHRYIRYKYAANSGKGAPSEWIASGNQWAGKMAIRWSKNTLPKSQIGKAMRYTIER